MRFFPHGLTELDFLPKTTIIRIQFVKIPQNIRCQQRSNEGVNHLQIHNLLSEEKIGNLMANG